MKSGHGTSIKGKKAPKRMTPEMYDLIKAGSAAGMSKAPLSRLLGISMSTISGVRTGRRGKTILAKRAGLPLRRPSISRGN